MTLSAFDIGMVKNYNELKYLLHFQWNDGTENYVSVVLVKALMKFKESLWHEIYLMFEVEAKIISSIE